MGIKKVLGLDESFPMKDSEIMRRIKEAQANRQEILELSAGGRKVVIKLSQISPEGMAKSSYEHY